MASTSNNLKGTFVKAIKEASASILEAAESMTSRTNSREVVVLRQENDRLRTELQVIREELRDLRSEVVAVRSRPPCAAEREPSTRAEVKATKERRDTPTNTGEELGALSQSVQAHVLKQVGAMLDARFAAIADRLAPERPFRPPLGPPEEPRVPIARSSGNRRASSAGRTPAGTTAERAARAAPLSVRKEVPSSSAPREDGRQSANPAESEAWSTVVRREKKKKKTATEAKPPTGSGGLAAKPSAAAPTPNGTTRAPLVRTDAVASSAVGVGKRPAQRGNSKRRVRVRQPRSAAIVLTLSPDAANRGETYAKILADARSAIKLPEHGLSAVGFRIAQTGARVIEVPGSNRVDTADRMAAELRTALADRGVIVSRPEKTADIRLTGLDESVTESEVEAAIRKVTGSLGQIKLGQIRFTAAGTGTLWVRCTVAAANKLSLEGRLLVGWVAARVHLLEPRPVQCFRCLERGHTRQRCPVEHDRSGLCYRCGQPDHLAAGCSAKPECPVCRDQGRGATHRCGGHACKAPPRRGTRLVLPGRSAGGSVGGNTPPSAAANVTPSEEAMEVAE